jgi:hypothetical protein
MVRPSSRRILYSLELKPDSLSLTPNDEAQCLEEHAAIPIMPLTSCFFVPLIYQAVAIWRSHTGFPSPVSNQC